MTVIVAALVNGTDAVDVIDRGERAGVIVVGEPGAWTIVGAARVAHPLFGEAHPIWITGGDAQPMRGDGEPLTWLGAIDWAAPVTIPPVLAPARLRGGTLLLNLIAERARDAGVAALRYAGPYPTSALWRSLAQSFRVLGGATEDDFTAGALERALRGDLSPIPIDFAPAPFVRVRAHARVSVNLRDEVERAIVDGAAYDRAGRERRLVAHGDGWAAELWLGDGPWCRVAELDERGAVVGEPRAPRPVDGALASMIGAPLPPPMLAALAEVVAELVAPPLAEAARRELAGAQVAWGDPGAAEVRADGDTLVVHAGLWAHLAPHGLGAVARGLALALAAPIAARAQARLGASYAGA